MKHPVRFQTYTTREILNELFLRDSPTLLIPWCGKETPVQDTHVTEHELEQVPGLMDLKWEYIKTTDEWIPVFKCNDVEAAMKCFDVEVTVDPYLGVHEQLYWITPKGFPQEQYYKRLPDGSIVESATGRPFGEV